MYNRNFVKCKDRKETKNQGAKEVMLSAGEIIEYAREYGLLSLFKAVANRFVFCREEQILLSLSLEEPLTEIQLPPNITMRAATLADVEELCRPFIKHNHLRSKKQISKWIAKGYPFFVAIADNKIVGHNCVAIGRPPVDLNLLKAINFKGDAWGSDAFVLPAYRGNMLYPALAIETMKCVKALGYRRVFGLVLRNNIFARSAHKKIGYKAVHNVTVFRILFYERMSIASSKTGILD